MAKNLPRVDVHALGRALQVYRKHHADEVHEMLVNDGWRPTAIYCARRCQHIALALKDCELSPCELKAERIGNLCEIWMADRRGIDLRRAQMVMLLRRMLHLGLSRYEPSPERACRAAEERRRALTTPTGEQIETST